jgi:hypothetical protein
MKTTRLSFFPSLTLFLTSLTLLFSTAAQAQVPSYVPTDGLVGYWPFNGNANDESGNGNNGVSTGVNLIADRNGELNSAYEFTTNGWSPGSQLSEVYIPYNNSFNVSQISISTWIKTYDWGWPGSWGVIIARFEQGYSNPNGESWAIGVSTLSNPLNNGELRSVLIEHPQNNFENIGNQLSVNDWTHLTVTFDGFVHRQYIDGVLAYQSSAPVGFVLNQQGTSGISIGVSDQANGHWQPYNGVIDDIGIWNRALTADEVLALYNGCNVTPQVVGGNTTPGAFSSSIYTCNNNAGSAYTWTVNNGVIVSGQGTNSVTILWGAEGVGSVSVVETTGDGCVGGEVVYNVNVQCVVSGNEITGPVGPEAFSNSTYTCNGAVNSTYNWTVTNGVIASGQGTNTVNILWASTGLGNVSVVETTAEGCVGTTLSQDVVVIPTNVEELSNQLILYPNPVATELNLQITSDLIGTDLFVFDALGKQILKQQILSTNTIINTSSFAAGNYVVKVGGVVKKFEVIK